MIRLLSPYYSNAPYPNVILIHGMGQTSATFKYLKFKLPYFNFIELEHSPYVDFNTNLDRMRSQISTGSPSYIIGHSLGGIYAMHLSQHINCIGGSTISTPHNGSRSATWAKYVASNYVILKDICPKSKPILTAHKFTLPGEWHNFISVSGHVPWINGDNDGVLTIDSMKFRDDTSNIIIDNNHYEIVLDQLVISTLEQNIILA